MYPLTALTAAALDATVGYPQWVFARIGHPVSWIGRLIAWCERRWNAPGLSLSRRRLQGLAALLVTVGITAGVCVAIVAVAESLLSPGLALLLVGALASTLIAQRSLYEHVSAVATALEQDGVAAGRTAVAQIVGRDTAALDTAAVSRAAIESLAENYSDGVVAPLFWLLVGGLPGAGVYKAINTADSMIGHKSERYRAYGWAAARLDDLVNLPASRLSALFILVAAALLPRLDASAAAHAVMRDARAHRSPNAGWPEAAMAGALGLRLAGPRVYGGVAVDDHWMGDGRAEATPADIRRALSVIRLACVLQALTIGCIAVVLA
jgi:adenosylcobinamide-phosphate synthase